MKKRFIFKGSEIKYTLRFKLLSLALDFSIIALIWTYGDYVEVKRWFLLQILVYILDYWTKTGLFAKKKSLISDSPNQKLF